MLINAFEGGLAETQQAREQLSTTISGQQAAIHSEDGPIARDSIRLLGAFEREFSVFEGLDKRFDQVGNVAIRAGQQLERLGEERRRALEAKEIIQAFMEFVGAPEMSAGRLEAAILSGGASLEGRIGAAQKLKRLVSLASIGSEEALIQILGLSQRVENSLLASFHTAFDAGDQESMRRAASILFAYNGGASCIQSFVGQHEFFQSPTSPELIKTKYLTPGYLVHYSDGIVEEEEADPALTSVFDQIVATSEEDWKYLQEVFENPSQVMDALLTRIFHEPVQVCLEETLRQARLHSLQAYLRALGASWRAARSLVNALGRVYERYAANPEAQLVRLNGLIGELFSPHLEPVRLVDRELRALQQILNLATEPLRRAVKWKKEQAKALFRSSTPVQVSLEGVQLYRFGAGGVGLVRPDEGADLVPSPAVVDRCLLVHADAVSRAFSLLPDSYRNPNGFHDSFCCV